MRNFIFFLLATTAFLLGGCQSDSSRVLNVFIWSDYIKTDLIERFEKKYDCNVVVDTYDSNESMYAKLSLGGGGYDVIFPSNYFMQVMVPQGMVKKLDKSKIDNLKHLDPSYLSRLTTDFLDFGVPYMISSTGILYRKDRIKQFESDPSWSIFGDSEYKGRMTMLNDSREVFAAALSYLGFDINTTNKDKIQQAIKVILNWKKNLAKFESEQYKTGIASAEYLVSQGYNGDSLQVMQEISELGFAYPKEGISVSVDYAVISADTPNPDLAYQFINFLLEPEVAAENMEFTYFLSPNKAAYELLPDHLAQNPVMFIPKQIFDKAELIRDLGPNNTLYHQAWDKIKAE
jgi:spermidine/putrescine transport system substrate-binding protein